MCISKAECSISGAVHFAVRVFGDIESCKTTQSMGRLPLPSYSYDLQLKYFDTKLLCRSKRYVFNYDSVRLPR